MNSFDLNVLLDPSASTINLMSTDCEECERTVLESHNWSAFPNEVVLLWAGSSYNYV